MVKEKIIELYDNKKKTIISNNIGFRGERFYVEETTDEKTIKVKFELLESSPLYRDLYREYIKRF